MTETNRADCGGCVLLNGFADCLFTGSARLAFIGPGSLSAGPDTLTTDFTRAERRTAWFAAGKAWCGHKNLQYGSGWVFLMRRLISLLCDENKENHGRWL